MFAPLSPRDAQHLCALFRVLSEGGALVGQRAKRWVTAHRLGPLCFDAGDRSHRDDYVRSRVAAEVLERAALRVAKLMAEASVRFCFLKGQRSVVDLYDVPALRPMGDVDILVLPNHFRPACLALERGGAQCVFDGFLHHAATYRLGETFVDVHRGIVASPSGGDHVREFIGRASPEPARGGTAYRLDSVDALLVDSVHAARSDLVLPLISYVDIARRRRALSALAERLIWERAFETGFGVHVQAALRMTYRLCVGVELDRPVPPFATTPLHVLSLQRPKRMALLAGRVRLIARPADAQALAKAMVGGRLAALRASRRDIG